GDTYDPLLGGDFFDLGNVLDVIDHTDTTTNTQQVETQSSFTDQVTFTTGADVKVGTTDNSNFYFPKANVGGTDTITDLGGTNQMAFDAMDDMVVKFTIGSEATAGSVQIWGGPSNNGYSSLVGSGPDANYDLDGSSNYTGSPVSTIGFSDVGQYLFADDTVASLSGGYSAQTAVDPSAATAADDQGDIIVMPALEATDVGYVVAGSSTDDTITLNDAGMDGVIAFGKGGGDTFNIMRSFDGLLIGGITSLYDNIDNLLADGSTSGTDGIPDTYLNTFSYSTMFTGITGINATIAGYTSTWWDGSSWITESETSGVVNNTTTLLYNMLWDVGNFTGSAGNDAITFRAGSLNTLLGGDGDDVITMGSTAKGYTLNGGNGTDTLIMSGSANFKTIGDTDSTGSLLSNGADGTDGDMDLSGSTITGITTISLNDSNISGSNIDTGATTTLTMDSATALASGTTISYGANTFHAHIESDDGMDLSGVTLSNVDSIQLDTGNDTVGATLTMSSTSSLGATAIQIRSLESVTGTANDIIASADGMNLSNATLFGGISTINTDTGVDGTTALILNTATDLGTATINGNGANDSITLSQGGAYSFTGNTLSGIAAINGHTSSNEIIIDTSTNLGTVTINGNSIAADIITLSETGTYSFATNTLNSIDAINGTAGVDNITGSAGGDTINGKASVDTLTGGTGGDTFQFSNSASTDIITDFNHAETDQINMNVSMLVGGTRTSANYLKFTVMKGTGLRYTTTSSTTASSSLGNTWLFQAANVTTFRALVNSKLATNTAAWAAGGNLNAVGFIGGTGGAAAGKIMIVGGLVQAGTASVAFTGNTKSVVTLQSAITKVSAAASSSNSSIIDGGDIFIY
ncbi:MAG: hypothetical protein HQ513_09045, partial [Rhodospirillales bacterium]|nr:hypothetical protein [Rhodospirillales bacterium]